MMPLLALAAAYVIGGIPFGFLLVKLKTGQDVRGLGSGNIGATNVMRTQGRAIGILTLLLDIAKGWLAVYLTDRLTHGSVLWMSAAALTVVLGHVFPVFLRFRGGKGVASFVGAFLYLTPLALLAITIVFVVTVGVTRFISLGSVTGAICFPLAVWLILHPPLPVLLASAAGGLLVLWRHRSNIERLRAGTEHVFTWRKQR